MQGDEATDGPDGRERVGDPSAPGGAGPGHDAPTDLLDGDRSRRKRAALAVAPLLAIGVADLVLLLGWGVDPLWGFLILPPILFVCALAWVAFSTDFARDRTGE